MAQQNPIREMMDNAEALDLRRQGQIAEQVKVINRMKAKVAEAWQEGFNTGKSRAMRHMSDEPDLPLDVENPYADWIPGDTVEPDDDDGDSAVPALV